MVCFLLAHWSPAGRDWGCGRLLGTALLERQVRLTLFVWVVSDSWYVTSRWQQITNASARACSRFHLFVLDVCKVWAVQQEVPQTFPDPWRSPGSLKHPSSLPRAGAKGDERRRGGATAVSSHFFDISLTLILTSNIFFSFSVDPRAHSRPLLPEEMDSIRRILSRNLHNFNNKVNSVFKSDGFLSRACTIDPNSCILQQTPAYSRHTLHQDASTDRTRRQLHRHQGVGERHATSTVTQWSQVPWPPPSLLIWLCRQRRMWTDSSWSVTAGSAQRLQRLTQRTSRTQQVTHR